MMTSDPLIETDIEAYLKRHENKELLRFITCGSVDDGKSTLIGRLLYDSKLIFEDQLNAIEKDSNKFGTAGEQVDLALLVDGLQSEREQGITIDVAYRYFSTERRKFIVADTPGHEQYTRNMATGASTADLAIILIDARKGVQAQTKRHSYINHLLGIKHFIVAINKMDLVDFDETTFLDIKSDYEAVANTLGILQVSFIPISALAGDNVVSRSASMPWYAGKTLMALLETTKTNANDSLTKPFRFLVQYVNRPNPDFRGYCGSIAAGQIRVGDAVSVLPSGKSSRIKQVIPPSIVEEEVKTQEASAPAAVTLTLEDELDISRGDLLVKAVELPSLSGMFQVMLVWMNEKPLLMNQEYIIKRGATTFLGQFNSVNYHVDINTLAQVENATIGLNDIACCQLVLNQAIPFDVYSDVKETGSFIVIDKLSNATLAAGMLSAQADEAADKRQYSFLEKKLNQWIRKRYPEWQCQAI